MKFITLLLIVPTLIASAAALATEGRMAFTGHVSNASCAVLPLEGLAQGSEVREVKVTERLNIVVDTSHNACAGQVIPFTTHYQPSISAEPGRANTAILTLTYQ
jgi:type 1 fimbria pilin